MEVSDLLAGDLCLYGHFLELDASLLVVRQPLESHCDRVHPCPDFSVCTCIIMVLSIYLCLSELKLSADDRGVPRSFGVEKSYFTL